MLYICSYHMLTIPVSSLVN